MSLAPRQTLQPIDREATSIWNSALDAGYGSWEELSLPLVSRNLRRWPLHTPESYGQRKCSFAGPADMVSMRGKFYRRVFLSKAQSHLKCERIANQSQSVKPRRVNVTNVYQNGSREERLRYLTHFYERSLHNESKRESRCSKMSDEPIQTGSISDAWEYQNRRLVLMATEREFPKTNWRAW